jgi:hypothetical protein
MVGLVLEVPMRRGCEVVTGFVVLLMAAACTADDTRSSPGPADRDAASGTAGTGGGSTGGSGGDAPGGTSGAGATGTGGSPSTGGSPGTGGSPSTGGSPGTGGIAAGGAGTGDAASPPPGGAGPEPNRSCTLVWESGFETGFPGEWSGYDNGSWSPDGNMPAGRVSAWTIVDRASGEPVLEGDHAYRGWITAAAGDSHRAYPGIHDHVYATPLVNTFWVYLDVDTDRLGGGDWVHFGTWGNWTGTDGQWALHTMSMRDRRVEFAHTDPFLGEWIGPSPAPDFPLRQWVRFTVYIDYAGTTGFVQAWQDGVPILRADVSQLAAHPGDSLITAHWGMYAAAAVDHGTQYNDAIRLWALDAPLSDLQTEPVCGE